MLKNISNLNGAKTLNKEEQKEINGGGRGSTSDFGVCFGEAKNANIFPCDLPCPNGTMPLCSL